MKCQITFAHVTRINVSIKVINHFVPKIDSKTGLEILELIKSKGIAIGI